MLQVPYRRFIILITMLALCGAANAAKQHPLTLDDYGRPLVPLEFADGSTSLVLLDTSARRTGLKNSLASKHDARLNDYSVIRHFSAGGLLQLPYATFDTFSLYGRQVKENAVALYGNKSMHEGLVGFDMYRWHVLRFAPDAPSLELLPNTAAVGAAGWQVIAGRPTRHRSIILTTEYAGHKFEILLASGSSRTVINAQAARLLAAEGKIKKPVGGERLALGIDPKVRYLKHTVLPEFKIGPWELGDLPMLVTSLQSDQALGYSTSNFIMIGADVLMSQDVALDFRDFQIWVPGDGDGQASVVRTSSSVKK